MIWKFWHKNHIRTINDEYISEEFKKKHSDKWESHATLNFGKMDTNLEQEFWHGNLVDDVHEVRDNMEKIKKQRTALELENQVLDKIIIKDGWKYKPTKKIRVIKDGEFSETDESLESIQEIRSSSSDDDFGEDRCLSSSDDSPLNFSLDSESQDGGGCIEFQVDATILAQKLTQPSIIEKQAKMYSTMAGQLENYKFSLRKEDLVEPSKAYEAQGAPPIDIEILKKKKIGSGGQGDVFKIELKNQPGYFVDKVPLTKIKNIQEAQAVGNSLYNEFCIGQQLSHKNIIDYKYFMHKYNKDKK